MNNPPTITLKNISHQYSRRGGLILTEVDLLIKPGTTTCLYGPSGSGKSTLLSIIGMQTQPTKGQVFFDGVDVWSHDKLSKEVWRNSTAWVTQAANNIPNATALDNVALAPLCRDVAPDESYHTAAELLKQMQLEHLSGRKVRLLSGGQAQRVAVARSLAANCPLILADEPTGQLDRQSTSIVIDGLFAKASSGSTIVIASHDPEVVQRCDRRVSIVDGKLVLA